MARDRSTMLRDLITHMEILYFTAEWCGPCRGFGPIVQRAQNDGLPIRKVDVEKETAITAEYKIMNIPTIVKIRNGKEVARKTGSMTYDELIRFYKS